MRQHDLFAIGFDADGAQSQLQLIAQGQIAFGQSVMQQMRGRPAAEAAHDRLHGIGIEPVIGQPRPAELQKVRAGFENVADQMRHILALARRGLVGLRALLPPRADEKAGAGPRNDIARRGQPLVSLDHRVAAGAPRARERADRRQAAAARPHACLDFAAHCIDEIGDFRGRALQHMRAPPVALYRQNFGTVMAPMAETVRA
jgi:hypothetical protein